MPKFVIERDIPGAGKLTAGVQRAISKKSCNVLRDVGPQVQWVHSHVAADKGCRVQVAPDEGRWSSMPGRGAFPPAAHRA